MSQRAALLVGVALLVGCADPVPPANPFLGRYVAPLHIAHRGGRAELPEHTLYAYDYALTQLGTDVLEVDVRRTCDNQLVIAHDEDLTRILELPSTITASTLDYLRTLRVPFPEGAGVSATLTMPVADPRLLRIPTLGEVISRYRNCLLNIEVKDDADTEALITAISAHAAATLDLRNVCFASFSDSASRRLKQAFPAACHTYPSAAASCAALPRRLPGPLRAGAIDCPDYDLFALPDDHGLFSRSLIESLHAIGRTVHVWTVDDKARMAELIDWGVDGIMTDRPAVLREVMVGLGLPTRQQRPEPQGACEIVPLELVDARTDPAHQTCASPATVP